MVQDSLIDGLARAFRLIASARGLAQTGKLSAQEAAEQLDALHKILVIVREEAEKTRTDFASSVPIPMTVTIPNRGLNVHQASEYCGLHPTAFRTWLARLNIRCRIPGTYRYDRHALDAALDRLTGLAQKPEAPKLSAYDKWKAKDNAKKVARVERGM